LKKCQELLKNIQASHFWIAVAQSVAVCEKKDMLQQQLTQVDVIDKNLNELKYAKCQDFQGDIQRFLMTLFTGTSGMPDLREKVSQLLDFATQAID